MQWKVENQENVSETFILVNIGESFLKMEKLYWVSISYIMELMSRNKEKDYIFKASC